jgi:hypothetical protein
MINYLMIFSWIIFMPFYMRSSRVNYYNHKVNFAVDVYLAINYSFIEKERSFDQIFNWKAHFYYFSIYTTDLLKNYLVKVWIHILYKLINRWQWFSFEQAHLHTIAIEVGIRYWEKCIFFLISLIPKSLGNQFLYLA